jgi:hypothetical protein
MLRIATNREEVSITVNKSRALVTTNKDMKLAIINQNRAFFPKKHLLNPSLSIEIHIKTMYLSISHDHLPYNHNNPDKTVIRKVAARQKCAFPMDNPPTNQLKSRREKHLAKWPTAKYRG